MFGSSPRTWGTQGLGIEWPDLDRFIPTYMGNAGGPSLRRHSGPVHPHVHGERLRIVDRVVLGIGSSPRTWGTRIFGRIAPTWWRFIPTYMGNASRSRLRSSRSTVHPHVHGERAASEAWIRSCDGSSPRTWGTLGSDFPEPELFRFIPTYMGNAPPHQPRDQLGPVHPHVHGERNLCDCLKNWVNGSSPRTWGTPPPDRAPTLGARFIPTYMGNAQPPPLSSTGHTVHPHVHGERTPVKSITKHTTGSSPRTWGTR